MSKYSEKKARQLTERQALHNAFDSLEGTDVLNTESVSDVTRQKNGSPSVSGSNPVYEDLHKFACVFKSPKYQYPLACIVESHSKNEVYEYMLTKYGIKPINVGVLIGNTRSDLPNVAGSGSHKKSHDLDQLGLAGVANDKLVVISKDIVPPINFDIVWKKYSAVVMYNNQLIHIVGKAPDANYFRRGIRQKYDGASVLSCKELEDSNEC